MNSKNIFGAFTVAIALFFLWPGIFSSWAEKSVLQATLAGEKEVLAERTRILAKAREEYATLQNITQSASGENFSSLIPEKKDAAELVSAAQAIAAAAGLQMSKLQIVESATKTAEQYVAMTLVIEMSGPYSGLREFLSNLEDYVRILNVKSIKAESDQRGSGQLFTIRADTYYIK